MQKNTTRLVLWAVALLITARLTWISIQHHMPILDTAVIALFTLYGAHTGAENITRSARTARQTGANR